MTDIPYYFQKHNILAEQIISVYRHGRNTVICCKAGLEVNSSIPMYEMLDFLPGEEFISISRSVIVRRDQILHISNNGIYTMSDGKTFQGRTRYLSTHRKLKKELEGASLPSIHERFVSLLGFYEKFSILDDMPLAYCVIELVFDKNGHGIDFIFRYCNKQMAVVEGIPVEKMLNHSFYEVFKNGDKKWLVTYSDVALNGTTHKLYDYSPEINKNLTIHCYQPEPGFCACILIPDENSVL